MKFMSNDKNIMNFKTYTFRAIQSLIESILLSLSIHDDQICHVELI